MLLRSQQLLLSLPVKAVEKGMVIAGKTASQLEEVAGNSKTTQQMRLMESQRHLRHRQNVSSRLIMV